MEQDHALRNGRGAPCSCLLQRFTVRADPLATDVDPQHALSLLERPETFPGIGVAAEPSQRPSDGRPDVGGSPARLRGRPSADEVTGSEGELGDADLVGRSGLEAEYDQVLRGTNGRSVVSIDPRGAVTGTLASVPPTPVSTC